MYLSIWNLVEQYIFGILNSFKCPLLELSDIHVTKCVTDLTSMKRIT